MEDLTQEETQLLLAAKKLRQVVQHDINRTAKTLMTPFIKEVVAVLAAEKSNKVKASDLEKIPLSAWAKIASNVSGLARNTSKKTASAHQTKTRETLAFVEKSLSSKDVAEAVVLASVKLASAPSPNLLKALALVDKAQAEIALLREFV
jgi:hypothetical protein